jgi:hypothetical protein
MSNTKMLIGLEHVESIKDEAVRAELEQLVAGIQQFVSAQLSGTNTGNVTLAGTPNYITISGQVITRSLINLASHVTGVLPVANGGTGHADGAVRAGDLTGVFLLMGG